MIGEEESGESRHLSGEAVCRLLMVIPGSELLSRSQKVALKCFRGRWLYARPAPVKSKYFPQRAS